VAKDNGRQENPDTPDKEEEAEAIHALRPKRYLKTYEIFFIAFELGIGFFGTFLGAGRELRKHNGIASGKGCVASYFAYLLPPLVPSPTPTPLAQALRRALVQLHRRPW
jgi:hypothetical protein